MPTKKYLVEPSQLPDWYNLKNYSNINELTLESLIRNLEVRVNALDDIAEYSLSLDGDLKSHSPFWNNVINKTPFEVSPFFEDDNDFLKSEAFIREDELKQELLKKNLLQEDSYWGTKSPLSSSSSIQPLEYCDLINLGAIDSFNDIIGGNFNIAINSLLSSELNHNIDMGTQLILEDLEQNFYLKIDLKQFSDNKILSDLATLLPIWRKALLPRDSISKKYNDFGSIKNTLKQIIEWGLIPKLDLQIWLWDTNQQMPHSTPHIISHELFMVATTQKYISLDGYKKAVSKPEKELKNFSTIHKLKSFCESNPASLNAKLAELFN